MPFIFPMSYDTISLIVKLVENWYTRADIHKNKRAVVVIIIIIILVPFFRVDGSKQNSFSKTCHHVKIVWIRSEINIVGNWFF
jgi:hypothetical protein